MDFSRLEKSIMDVIKEEQAKLGYRKEKIRLYYPLSSLNHFFQVEGDVTGMLEKLNWFSEYTKQRLGQVEVTNEGERFCFHIPEEGVEYVHERMKENEFIKELIGLLQKHDCTMEEIFDLFRSHSEKVEIHEMDNGEKMYSLGGSQSDWALLSLMAPIFTALKMKAVISSIMVFCRKIMQILHFKMDQAV